MERKTLFAAAGSRENRVSTTLELLGTWSSEPLTPKMARRAARIAFGHEDAVTIYDDAAGYGYVVYRNSTRKFHATIDSLEGRMSDDQQ